MSIGAGATIGPGVRMRESIVLDNAVIKDHTLVLHSISELVVWSVSLGRLNHTFLCLFRSSWSQFNGWLLGPRRRHTQRSRSEQTIRQNGKPAFVQFRGKIESIDYDSGLLCDSALGEDTIEFNCFAAQRADQEL